MSGIYGFTYRAATDMEFDDALDAMVYWNRSYGSDASAYVRCHDSALGSHVEHFSDKFPCSEPVQTFRDGYAVVDALLYNRDELFELLPEQHDTNISDEFLLLRLIDVHGFDVLKQVNGDFAGAIFDPDTAEWTLFRDHLGVRPLHIYTDSNLFAFSTDLRALAAIPQADCKPNEELLYRKLSGGLHITLQETEFANIRCAAPASITRFIMTERRFEATERVYWKLCSKKIRFQTDEQYRQELCRLVTDSVHRRCDAIPGVLGAELSGGLDSTVIDILINRYGRELKCYSWSYDPEILPITQEDDERKLVLDVCAQEGFDCRFNRPTDQLPLHLASNTLMPPMTNTRTISYGSAWLKSQGVNVVFSGHGGDQGVSHRASRHELFCSGEYLSYFKLYWLDAKGRRLRPLRAAKWGLKGVAERSAQKPYSEEELRLFRSVMDPGFAEHFRDAEVCRNVNFNYAPLSHVNRGALRPRLDTCAFQGALNGVRYLFPFLDYRVIDFALSIPRRLYINQTDNRVIYRETFQDLLPASMRGGVRKATVSIKAILERADSAQHFLESRERLMDRLDRDYWKDTLNFDAIEALIPSPNPRDNKNEILDRIIGCLWQCVSIQKFQTAARNWREFDEQDKTV